MCLHPISLKSFAQHLPRGYAERFPWMNTLSGIQVPCGHCPECLYKKQGFIVQRSEMMSLTYDCFFCTLTYNNDNIPFVDVGNFRHYYASQVDLTNFFKRLRNKCCFGGLPYKYLAVSEFGKHTHRPHFHILFWIPKPETYLGSNYFGSPDDYRTKLDRINYLEEKCLQWHDDVLSCWSKNIGSDKKPVYVPLCTFTVLPNGRRNFDFHYVNPYEGDNTSVYFYVTKYMLKFDKWIEKKQIALKLNLESDYYDTVWNLIKPRKYISKHYGDSYEAISYIKGNLEESFKFTDKGYFVYVSPYNGQISPLCPYYRKKVVTVDLAMRMIDHRHKYDIDYNIYSPLDDTRSIPNQVLGEYNRRCEIISENNFDYFLDFPD